MRGGLPPVVKHYYVSVINKEKYMKNDKEGQYYSPAKLSTEFSLPNDHFLLKPGNHSPKGGWVRIISIKLESDDKTLTDTDKIFFGKIGVIDSGDMTLPDGTVIEYIDSNNKTLIKRKITEKSAYNILHSY